MTKEGLTYEKIRKAAETIGAQQCAPGFDREVELNKYKQMAQSSLNRAWTWRVR
jgi:hypothetical protein